MSTEYHNWFLDAYRLTQTMRYSMKALIHEESVAEHSFFVGLGVMILAEKYEFDVGVAVQMALSHDLAELKISDVNFKVKKQFPDLARVLSECEREYNKQLPFEQMRVMAEQYDLMDTPEALVVKYCDAWQCQQKAHAEQQLGNVNDTLEIEESSIQRMNDLEKQLEPYLREQIK